MIDRIQIRNFKCLRNVEVRLSPFTVLIGPNDSGKTSLMDAIGLLGKTATTGLGTVFSVDNSLRTLAWRRTISEPVIWEADGHLGTTRFAYKLAIVSPSAVVVGEELLVGDERWLHYEMSWDAAQQQWSHPKIEFPAKPQLLHRLAGLSDSTGLCWLANQDVEPFRAVSRALASSTKYKLDPDALRQSATPRRHPVLTSTGSNLVAVLDGILSGPNRAAGANIEQSLREAVPSLQGITLPVDPAGHEEPVTKSLWFVLAGEEHPPITIPAAHASDGALLLLAFLALGYGGTQEILFVEEPENGFHHSRCQQVVDLLRKMTTGEVGGSPRQVIIATHSPLFLNLVNPEEVRIFRRTQDGGVQVTAMHDVPNIQGLLKEFGPGELWHLFGEDALVKGAQQ